MDGSIVSAKIYNSILPSGRPWQQKLLSPFHGEPVLHLLHSVVLGVQQLSGPLLSNAAEPRLVQLSHAGAVLRQQGALRPVDLLHFLEKLLRVLAR